MPNPNAANSAGPTLTGRPRMPADYGLAAADPANFLPWSWADLRLTLARNYWLGTTRPDGRPHVSPVWGVWLENALYFGTDPNSVKGKNLAANPAVAVHLESGDEVVILEGVVELLPDTAQLPPLDDAYAAKYNLKLSEAGANAAIWVVRPQVALAWLEHDFLNTATRWRFE